MKKYLLFAFNIVISLTLLSAPYNGKKYKFEQPDGTNVEVRLFGNEYYSRAESLDGYTLIRDNSTGYICYAKLSSDGKNLVSTGIIYKNEINSELLGLNKHIDIPEEEIQKKAKEKYYKYEGEENLPKSFIDKDSPLAPEEISKPETPSAPVSGKIKSLTILVDFSDEPASVPVSEVEEFLNSDNYTGYGNNGSLKQYYSDVSGGLVELENVVYGYFRAPKTFAEYDNMADGVGAEEILDLALHWIDNQGFDFSTLSTDNGYIKAINLMYTGNPKQWGWGMWYYAGGYYGFSADGVTTGRYNCSPSNAPLTLETLAHENGHMIGNWPDTYKYFANTGDGGIGNFDIMAASGTDHNPPPPNPYFRHIAGWADVVDVTSFDGVIKDACNSLTVYKYDKSSTEYFLIEARQNKGRSEFLPDEGLTIWHVDENGDNQTTHHEVYLEHADNDISTYEGACWKSGFNETFDNNSTPNSKWYDNTNSGLRIWDIGSVLDTMIYKIGDALEPVADFSASKTVISIGNTITFSPVESLSGNTYSWELEGANQSTSTEKSPTVTYNQSGIFKVSLKVSNQYGSEYVEKENYIVVYGSEYCEASASTSAGADYIVNVSFGDINNNSGKSQYSNYTNLTSIFIPGETFTMTIELNWTFDLDQGFVWIDWNGDGTFADSERTDFPKYSNDQASVQITVPQDAVEMCMVRVRSVYMYNNDKNPCGVYDGEVEDYTLLVASEEDCNGDLGGVAYLDECGECVGGNTNKIDCANDCNGDLGGTAYHDQCNICVEGNTGLSACTVSNIAVNKTATQSSTNYEAYASRAVDGNTDGIMANNSVTHTLHQSSNWWQVDLEDNYEISFISIWNRVEVSDRLRDYDVIIYDESMNVVWTSEQRTEAERPTNLEVEGVLGRYVKVQSNLSLALSLAEVEVFGKLPNVVTDNSKIQKSNNQSLKVYPNPNKGKFTIEGINLKDYKLCVYDISGVNVYCENFNFKDEIINNQIDLQNLSKGVYYIELGSNTINYMKKIVILE